MQREAGTPGTRRRRLSDGSRRDVGNGSTEESNRKRRRRILSCDTCRRQKCRCEVDEESEACSRCRSLRITCTWNDSGDTHSVSSKEAPSVNKPDLEGRIRSLEASISDLRATIQMLAPGVRPDVRRTQIAGRQERQVADKGNNSGTNAVTYDEGNDTASNAGSATTTVRAPVNEDVEPADRHVYSSPAEVVRKVGSQLSGGYRRTFDVQADLVSLGIIDEKTARDLVAEFVRRRRNALLINSEVDLAPRNRDLRHASPFLHDACCLHAMRFSEHSSSVLHRRVFEHVRLQLGQLIIASPLPIEELTGILVMSMWASSPSSPEYIDSWLLSGHCAQQAMLSINFSEVLSRTKSRTSTDEDQRVMRLWANTCLVNLHWAATTGRPATVPAAYLQQCKLLLNFEEVTMRDAMVYAEITLYLLLQDKFSQRSYLGSDGECEELLAWKARWSYLFELPAASTLRITHSIAWLILARRTLEHDQASSDQDSLSSSPRLNPVDAVTNQGRDPQQHHNRQNPPHDMMHARVCSFATDVVRAFVEMPSSRAEELPEFHRLCVAYAMLIISKYEQQRPAESGVSGGSGNGGGDPGEEVLQLLRAAEKQNMVWSASSPSAIQFGLERALKKMTARVEGARAGTAVPGTAAVGGAGVAGSATPGGGGADNRAPHRIAMSSPRNLQQGAAAAGTAATWGQHHQHQEASELQQQHQHDHPSSFMGTTLVPEFDGSLSLETMDFFFSGGHLGLGDHSFF